MIHLSHCSTLTLPPAAMTFYDPPHRCALSFLCPMTLSDITDLLFADDIFRLLAVGNRRMTHMLSASVRRLNHRYDLIFSPGWPTSLSSLPNLRHFSSTTEGSEYADAHWTKENLGTTIPPWLTSILPPSLTSLRLVGAGAISVACDAIHKDDLPVSLEEIYLHDHTIFDRPFTHSDTLKLISKHLPNLAKITIRGTGAEFNGSYHPSFKKHTNIEKLPASLTHLWIAGQIVFKTSPTISLLPPLLQTLFIRYIGTTLELFRHLPQNLTHLDYLCNGDEDDFMLSGAESLQLPRTLTTLYVGDTLCVPLDNASGFHSNLPPLLVNMNFGHWMHKSSGTNNPLPPQSFGVEIPAHPHSTLKHGRGNLTPNVIAAILAHSSSPNLNLLNDVGHLELAIDENGIHGPINMPPGLESLRIRLDERYDFRTVLLDEHCFGVTSQPRLPPSLLKLKLVEVWLSPAWCLSEHTRLQVLQIDVGLVPEDVASYLPRSLRMLRICIWKQVYCFRPLGALLRSLPPLLVDFRINYVDHLPIIKGISDDDFDNLPRHLRFLKLPQQCENLMSLPLIARLGERLDALYIGSRMNFVKGESK